MSYRDRQADKDAGRDRSVSNTTKKFMRNFKNVVKNYSDIERAVREATSNDACDPPRELLEEIVAASYDHSQFDEMMSMLWKRANPQSGYWRHNLKSLIVLETLFIKGHAQVFQDARRHLSDLRELSRVQIWIEDVDHGVQVRSKAKKVLQMMVSEQEKGRAAISEGSRSKASRSAAPAAAAAPAAPKVTATEPKVTRNTNRDSFPAAAGSFFASGAANSSSSGGGSGSGGGGGARKPAPIDNVPVVSYGSLVSPGSPATPGYQPQANEMLVSFDDNTESKPPGKKDDLNFLDEYNWGGPSGGSRNQGPASTPRSNVLAEGKWEAFDDDFDPRGASSAAPGGGGADEEDDDEPLAKVSLMDEEPEDTDLWNRAQKLNLVNLSNLNLGAQPDPGRPVGTKGAPMGTMASKHPTTVPPTTGGGGGMSSGMGSGMLGMGPGMMGPGAGPGMGPGMMGPPGMNPMMGGMRPPGPGMMGPGAGPGMMGPGGMMVPGGMNPMMGGMRPPGGMVGMPWPAAGPGMPMMMPGGMMQPQPGMMMMMPGMRPMGGPPGMMQGGPPGMMQGGFNGQQGGFNGQQGGFNGAQQSGGFNGAQQPKPPANNNNNNNSLI